MFELEVDHKHIEDERSEAEIISHFHFGGENIQGVALLPWEEHCTECAMPQCYATCDLYEARKDGKCRRFVHGITPVRGVDNVQGYVVKLAFKQWGQLMAYANVNMVPLNRARTIERGFRFFDEFISRIPDGRLSVKGRRGLSSRLARRFKQSIAANGYFQGRDAGDPDYFLVEVYNPNDFQVDLSLSINNTGDRQSAMPFQRLLKLVHGYNEFKIDFGGIARLVDVSNKFGISFNPNIVSREEEGLCLYFGCLTFVWDFDYKSKSGSENDAANDKAPHIKVVAWDLDNTVWDGVLIEDGADNLRIKPGIVEIIQQLDKRGILNTVVSKNNHDDALSLLERIGIDKYFLRPKIGWGQKGVYIRELVAEFNVGADTFAFIDDSPFERDEVRSLNPDVRVYDAVEYKTLLDRPEFSPLVTTESNLRRQYYMYDESRKAAMSNFAVTISSFSGIAT